MNSYPFSKVIHTMWYQGMDEAPQEYRGNPSGWRRHNPGYEVLEWNYVNLTEFIAKHYPRYFVLWNNLDRVIKKSDFARLLLLHYFGGVYVDLDLIPRSPIDTLLNSGLIYCGKVAHMSVLPSPPPVEHVDLHKFDTIFTREYRMIDKEGFGIANGAMICKPSCQWILDFIDSRLGDSGGKVLDFVGPHALTRFIRGRKDLYPVVKALPPYYFIWEKAHMQEAPPSWCVSIHPAKNSWGDASRKDFWNI